MAPRAQSRRTPLGHAYGDVSALNPRTEKGRSNGKYELSRDAAGNEIELYDLTASDRFGLKGRGAGDWLGSHGVELPTRINTMVSALDGLDLVRLGAEDFLVLSRPDAPSTSLADLRARWEKDVAGPKGFNAWRDEVWAWFHLCGDNVSEFMAKTCPVDLHRDRFPTFSVAQTRVAQMDCVVVRSDRARKYGLDLFFDIASSAYALRSLEELGS